jgi:hypothetical protein
MVEGVAAGASGNCIPVLPKPFEPRLVESRFLTVIGIGVAIE